MSASTSANRSKAKKSHGNHIVKTNVKTNSRGKVTYVSKTVPLAKPVLTAPTLLTKRPDPPTLLGSAQTKKARKEGLDGNTLKKGGKVSQYEHLF